MSDRPELNPSELDDRIRTLVARAVADAPEPPRVDPTVAGRDHHRRWWIGGGVTLAAAAAATIVAVATFVVDEDDRLVTTPATEPTIAPDTVPFTVPATEPSVAPTTVLESGPTSTAPTTQPTEQPVGVGGALVTAGPDGVIEHRGGESTVITTEPMRFAISLGDGRYLVQRASGYDTVGATESTPNDPADTAPLVLASDGTIKPLWLDAEPAFVTVHDVAVVDGQTLLLYTSAPQPPQSLDDDSGEVAYVIDLADPGADLYEIAQVSGWEYGVNRLHLASSGLIVGEWNAGPSHGLEVHAVPESPADFVELPTPEDLGLPNDGFGDCGDCPRAFSVTQDGSAVFWVDPSDDLSTVQLVTAPLDGTDVVPTSLGIPTDGDLVIDSDHDGRRTVLTFWPGQARPPLVLEADARDVGGITATIGLAADSAGQPDPPPSATPPPASPALPWRTVTAGPAGIVVAEDGKVVRDIDEPAERALLASDGTIVFQRRAGYDPFTAPDETIPQFVQPDDSVVPFAESANGWYELHDIEQIAGHGWMLLSETTQAANDSLTERASLIELDDFGVVDLGIIGGDEFGTSRLHLAENGVVVGTSGEETVNGLFARNAFDDLPETPTEPVVPTPADLGLEDRTGDCALCPNPFTITPDGTAVAWLEGQALVVHDIASGEQQRWSSDAFGHVLDGPDGSDRPVDLDVVRTADGTVLAVVNFAVDADAAPSPVALVASPDGGAELVILDGINTTLGPDG